jgi:hypothetical protein
VKSGRFEGSSVEGWGPRVEAEVKGKQGRKESLRAFDARLDLPSRPL